MPLNIQTSENSITQVAETVAVGGTGVGGSGGNATAVTDQDASITDNDSLVSSSPATGNPIPLNIQSSENSIIQVAETAAVGGTGVDGSGGNAVAVTDQDASITDNDSLVSSSPDYAPEYFPWSGPDMNLQISANPIIQVGTSVAVGGPGVFGDGGDAIAVTNQDAAILDNDFLGSF